MPLSTAEIESLRFHLGYGNIGVGGYPYTGDGFFELFYNVVAPNLSEGATTSSTTAIAIGTQAVTPVSMTGITVNERLVIDVAGDAELVTVRSTTATTFTAAFAKTHPATGYPIAVFSGIARVRWYLWEADKAWQAITGDTGSGSAGVKKVDEIEFFGNETSGNTVLAQKRNHYRTITDMLAQLCRVQSAWPSRGGGLLEAY